MSSNFEKREETLDWVEIKANAIWKEAGGFDIFTTKFKRMKVCYSARIKVGGGQSRAIAVHCPSAAHMRDNRPQIVVPGKIAQAWEKMGVDCKEGNDNAFRFRLRGMRHDAEVTENSPWCLHPAGDARISAWVQNIANAVRRLEGGK